MEDLNFEETIKTKRGFDLVEEDDDFDDLEKQMD